MFKISTSYIVKRYADFQSNETSYYLTTLYGQFAGFAETQHVIIIDCLL